jgi:type IV pilus assembly protein PilW
MKKTRPFQPRRRGMSLIEVMVAMVLGLLLSAGIITVFQAGSTSNRVQNGLARLQENGRYLAARLGGEIRTNSAQFCSSIESAFNTSPGQPAGNGVQPVKQWMRLNAPSLQLPDSAGAPLAGPTDISPGVLLRGYDCTASACTPATPALPPGLPAAGAAAGNRVRGSDVLVLRAQRGNGWHVQCDASNTVMTPGPDPGSDAARMPPLTLQAGDLAMLTSCFGPPQIFTVALNGGGFVPAAGEPGPACPGNAGITDLRMFDVSRDFVSATYYLRLRADENPDRPGRLISVLVRREQTLERERAGQPPLEQELAQGVERLDFVYGVENAAGAMSYMNAGQVDAMTGGCPRRPALPSQAPPAAEPGCHWRSVKSIEVHMLLNTVDDQFDLGLVDTAYRYSIDGPAIAPPPALMPVTGLASGRMMRREFVSYVSLRNTNL